MVTVKFVSDPTIHTSLENPSGCLKLQTIKVILPQSAIPQAILNIISNPVNSTVPIAAETLKRLGVYDKRKVMGVTTLDVVSALGVWFYQDPTHGHTRLVCYAMVNHIPDALLWASWSQQQLLHRIGQTRLAAGQLFQPGSETGAQQG